MVASRSVTATMLREKVARRRAATKDLSLFTCFSKETSGHLASAYFASPRRRLAAGTFTSLRCSLFGGERFTTEPCLFYPIQFYNKGIFDV